MLRPRVVKIGAAVLSSSLLAAAFPAQASSVRVRYSEDELSSVAGARAVLERIRTASHRACMEGSIAGYRLRPDCREELIEEAVAELDRPTVTALWTIESGRFQLASAQ